MKNGCRKSSKTASRHVAQTLTRTHRGGGEESTSLQCSNSGAVSPPPSLPPVSSFSLERSVRHLKHSCCERSFASRSAVGAAAAAARQKVEGGRQWEALGERGQAAASPSRRPVARVSADWHEMNTALALQGESQQDKVRKKKQRSTRGRRRGKPSYELMRCRTSSTMSLTSAGSIATTFTSNRARTGRWSDWRRFGTYVYSSGLTWFVIIGKRAGAS